MEGNVGTRELFRIIEKCAFRMKSSVDVMRLLIEHDPGVTRIRRLNDWNLFHLAVAMHSLVIARRGCEAHAQGI